MIKDLSAVLIWSENYRKLADWYIEKLELKPIEELNHPKDTGVGFRVGKMYFLIGQHSKVKGKNKTTNPSVGTYPTLISLVRNNPTETFDSYFNELIKIRALY